MTKKKGREVTKKKAGTAGETSGPSGPDVKLPDDRQAARRAGLAVPPPAPRHDDGHKYRRLITPVDGGPPVVVDVYSVLQAFGVTCQARGHAIKKALLPGARGHKTARQDLEEAVVALRRAIDFTPPDCPPERSWRLVGGDATPPGGL